MEKFIETCLNSQKKSVKGLYASFSQLVRNEPFMVDSYEVSFDDNSKKKPRYEVLEDNYPSKRHIPYFSDGEHLYLHASNYHYGNYFIKALDYGKYIYFEDTYSNRKIDDVKQIIIKLNDKFEN